jgi:hypothetical protein
MGSDAPASRPHLLAGLIIAVLAIVVDLVLPLQMKTVPDTARLNMRLAIVLAGVLAACFWQAKKSGMGRFNEVFAYGFKVTTLLAFVLALYTWIAVKFIYPPPTAAEMEAAIKAIEAQGNSLHEEARLAAEKAAANRWIVYVSATIFSVLLPGVAASAIAGLFAKKNT